MSVDICETCGAAFHGRHESCPDCGANLPDSGEIRRLPHEVVHQFLAHAEEFLTSSPLRGLALSFAGGAFITFGAALAVSLTVEVDSFGVSGLLLGLGLSVGYIMVMLSGAALFTEINVILPELFLSRPRDLCRRCLPFWGIAILGNVLGALFVGAMINGAHVFGSLQEERLFELIEEKMQFRDMGVEGWFIVLVSGILANWLVGMAAFMATAGRTLSGKILGIVPPIVAYLAIGALHAPANMAYFSIGLIGGGSGYGWGEVIWWNLIPAAIGNIIGGAIFVALLFWYTYGHHPQKRESLRQAHQLVREKLG